MAEPGAVEQVAEIRRCLNLRKPADISPAWQRALSDHGDDTPPGPAGEAR
jgi:hypothetical protein